MCIAGQKDADLGSVGSEVLDFHWWLQKSQVVLMFSSYDSKHKRLALVTPPPSVMHHEKKAKLKDEC